MSSATFTQTRTSAFNLENQTENLLRQYSKLQQSTLLADSDEDELHLVDQITALLEKRDEVVAALNRASDADANVSTSKLQQLQRHKEVLAEHKVSFSKIQNRIADERNRNNLLFLIQSDISAHKQRTVSLAANNENDYALDEAQRVDSANSFAERLLLQAYETRDELLSQRAYLQNALSRIQGSLLLIPGINVLILRINTRRKRDTLILAAVIAVCIIILFFLG